MAECIVQVALIDNIVEHSNADSLEILEILGWQIISQKGLHKVGNKIVYFPPDTVISNEWGDKFNCTKYLKSCGEEGFGRVGKIKLRGEPSFGLVIPCPDDSWQEGDIVNEYFGARKYNPPVKILMGNVEKEDPLFEKYTSIENLRNHKNVLEEGEIVIVTEKIHGSNSRVGLIEGELMIGSRTMRRKIQDGDGGVFQIPLENPGVRAFLDDAKEQGDCSQVIIYGEVYGCGIQKKFNYAHTKKPGFRAFDILCDGKYIDYDSFKQICTHFGIEMAPVLYEGKYDLNIIKELSKGKTTLGDTHIREGVVIRPAVERHHKRVGRVILKYISDDYLLGNYEDTTDA